jgi:hypothetical protein
MRSLSLSHARARVRAHTTFNSLVKIKKYDMTAAKVTVRVSISDLNSSTQPTFYSIVVQRGIMLGISITLSSLTSIVNSAVQEYNTIYK